MIHRPLFKTIVLLAVFLPAAHGQRWGHIPPEVKKNMDADILEGKRPRFKDLLQNEILELREGQRFDVDFVRFRFQMKKLSTVERDIVKNWIRSGKNAVFLEGNDLHEYAELLAPVQCKWILGSPKLLNHPVNTDCDHATFKRVWKLAYPCLYNVPADVSIIAEGEPGAPVCGSFTLGKGVIMFRLTPDGPDADRWDVNFWHWALGLRVPPPVDTKIEDTK
ncbi:MAG: hypothetical protein N3G20_05220 [Verrucomicrobiae bacterium]|nr:hypothetical protein [Verrucomicrobiae bacterium]